MSARARLAIIVLLAAVGSALVALVPDVDVGSVPPTPVDLEIAWRDGIPVVTLPPEPVRDVEVIARLPAKKRTYAEDVLARVWLGGEQKLVTRVEAFRGGSELVASGDRGCVVVRDAWLGELRYRVGGGSTERVDDPDLFLARCVAVDGVALVPSEAPLRSGDEIEIVVTRQLNPHDATTMEATRRWLANPDGEDGVGNTFYGQIVGIFVIRLGEPELSSRMRSARAARAP